MTFVFRVQENPPFGWDVSLLASREPDAPIVLDQIHMPSWQDAMEWIGLFRHEVAAAPVLSVRNADA